MFSVVVLSAAVLAVVAAAPRPGLIGAPLVYGHVAPSAISHSSRVDVLSKPLLAYAPVVHAAPLIHAAPLAVSHSSRYDVHQSHPILSVGYGGGLGGYYGGHGLAGGLGGYGGLGHSGYSVGVGHDYGYGGHHGGYLGGHLGGHYW